VRWCTDKELELFFAKKRELELFYILDINSPRKCGGTSFPVGNASAEGPERIRHNRGSAALPLPNTCNETTVYPKSQFAQERERYWTTIERGRENEMMLNNFLPCYKAKWLQYPNYPPDHIPKIVTFGCSFHHFIPQAYTA
jgi:hypothetical protein